MRTIQMTLEDNLVESVDRIVRELKTTRSAFTRTALREAINNLTVRQLEKKHRKGYEIHPGGLFGQLSSGVKRRAALLNQC